MDRSGSGINTIERATTPERAATPRARPLSKPIKASLGSRMSGLLARERQAANGPVWIAVGIGIGAVQYATASREPHWLALLALLAIVGAVRFAVRERSGLRPVATFALAIASGLLAAKLEVARTDTAMMVGEATTRVTGIVERSTKDAKGRVRYDLTVVDTAEPRLQFPPSRARLFVSAKHERAAEGDTIEALARLRQPSGPAMPGGYDFAYHNYFDGIGAQGFALGAPRILEADRADAGSIEPLRRKIQTIVRGTVSGAEGGIAAALLTGDRRGIPDDVAESLRTTGLAHVLAISGMHMALISGLVLMLVRLVLSSVPQVAERFAVRKIAAASALLVATGYLLLSGMAVSAQRAWIMLAVMLVAILVDRAALTMRNVGLAAIVVLLVAPHEIMGPGMQMSFGATAALVAAYGWWRRVRAGRGEPLLGGAMRTIVAFAVGLFMTSLIAGTATGLFAAYHFHRVAPLGLLANLLAMPIVSTIVMPSGLVSMIAMPFGLEAPFLHLMGEGIALVVRVARWVEGLTPVHVTGELGPATLICGAISLILLTSLRTRLALVGILPLVLLPILPDAPRHELLVNEAGRSLAIASNGTLAYAPARGSGFERRQWATAKVAEPAPPDQTAWDCADGLCLIESNGLRLAHIDDVTLLGPACDAADIVVARQRLRTERCRSGAFVLSARRLNLTGSLAIDLQALSALASDRRSGSRLTDLTSETFWAQTSRSLATEPRPWTRHRATELKRNPRPSQPEGPAKAR